MNHTSKYAFFPLDNEPHAFRVTTDAKASTFLDHAEDLIIRALSPDAVPLLQAYLSGLNADTTWVAREDRGSAFIGKWVLPRQQGMVELHQCTSNKRTPALWYQLLIDDEHEGDLRSIAVLDLGLARGIFDALVSGALRIESA
ncbi:hypothetical protein WJ97_11990 [Burkholderia ubonensis]|uniref:hypothetical protein n=1 Tax=Burkholderia ubonensis TaxID=101571 RepID=UPI00075305AE|nr:hypothetical protein [Burkholderia ubonensis]KVP96598.1 hypothetical protein WJ97_11990 [Burkholderia ubonensis]